MLIHQRFVAELLDLALCSIPEEDDEKYEQDTEDEVGVCVCVYCGCTCLLVCMLVNILYFIYIFYMVCSAQVLFVFT